MPMKKNETIRLPEADGWRLNRTTGPHRHLVIRAGLVS
jgi:predicted RNA binding protein YcfA (HicA-like mRNA interferase family)